MKSIWKWFNLVVFIPLYLVFLPFAWVWVAVSGAWEVTVTSVRENTHDLLGEIQQDLKKLRGRR